MLRSMSPESAACALARLTVPSLATIMWWKTCSFTFGASYRLMIRSKLGPFRVQSASTCRISTSDRLVR